MTPDTPKALSPAQTPYEPPADWRSMGLALLVHALLVLVLTLGLAWKSEPPGPVQVELWADGVAPDARQPEEVQPDPLSEPEPEPVPEPTPEPPAPPEPPRTPPPPEIDPDIALEAERRRKAVEEAERLTQQRLEQERLEQERLEQERLEQERLEQERLEQERLAAERKEQERLEQERQVAERLEQERLSAEKAAAERKAREEAARKAAEEKAAAEKAAAEQRAKEEAARKAAAEKAAAEKAAAEKAAAAKRAAAEKERQLREAMRDDVLGAAGIPGGTADRNQAGGGRDDGYAARVRECILPHVSFSPPPGAANLTVRYRVQLSADGKVTAIALVTSSGNRGFDRAVEIGIQRCSPLPRPPSGRYPGYMDVYHRSN